MPGYGTEYGVLQYGLELGDVTGPLVRPVNPAADQTDVALDTNILVEITDEDGIIGGSVMVRIDRGYGFETAYKQDEIPAFKPGYNGPGSVVTEIAQGYQVIVDPETAFGNAELITVEITAADPSGKPERLV